MPLSDLPERASQTVALCIAAAAILLFILLFAGSAGKPLHLDNVDFPDAAQQTAFTGIPVCYRGEARPHDSALFHPPLYIYLLAAWIRVFGFGETQVRLFGMVCALLQGAVVLAIVWTLFGRALAIRWSPWFWAIFLLNPYTLQGASITDIDTTIYGPLLCLVLLLTLRISWRNGQWREDSASWVEYALIGAALYLCLWAKLTTVLLSFPAVFFLLVARRGVRRAFVTALALTMGSIMAFLASYYAFGALVRLDVSYTFRFTLMSFLQRGSNGAGGAAERLMAHWDDLRYMAPFMLSWTGLLPWLAAMLALWVSLRAWLRERDLRLLHYSIVLGLALLCTIYYCAQQKTFGSAPFKYTFVYWGVVLTAPLLLLTRRMRPEQWNLTGRKQIFLPIVLCIAVGLWASFHVGDSLMLNGFAGSRAWVAYIPALLFLAGLAASPYMGVAPMAALAVYCGLQFGIAVYQEKTPYSTTYDYGQTGFWDTIAFLKSNTDPNDVIASMKDIGFRSGLRYFETYRPLYIGPEDAARLEREAERGRIKFLVFTEGRGQDQLVVNPPLNKWVLDHCALVRAFGNYRIYRMDPNRGNSASVH